ncbi:hypothetical protein TRFO_17066 [Tritrichomonas foetus]|uniref:Protein kinase domain-containing protein n=1 Tax=Tritrichomonas foetus TaxID=1144522 RepID=A0A1J4KT00_9EUKA|nr:hypothetical protein TRFO_17066 [Tritrichomonas foetus]|eukprot:OHT12916.1 hypothetical protein TRFO_17066 [Tritrichomonas foetus]
MNDSVFAKAAPDYQLIEEIGEGAYSHVFYAKHKKLNFEAALKFCEIESFIKREELEYLKREIAISRAMNHPFIADLYDILKTDEFVIFVFEYIPGGNLLEFLNKIEINESL